MQKIWTLLLDDDLVSAYAHGIVLTCGDGVKRRIFPWFFTYAADYPEKYVARTSICPVDHTPPRVLIACIKYFSRCPCPRCLIQKAQIPETGTKKDYQRRGYKRRDDEILRRSIARARKWIFVRGVGVTGKSISDVMKNSELPNQVSYFRIEQCRRVNMDFQSAFSLRLSEHGFDVYPMLVVDLLHEFELGVWKATFTHLIRILYAEGSDKIQILNKRQVNLRQHSCNAQFCSQVPTSTVVRRCHQRIRQQRISNEQASRTRL